LAPLTLETTRARMLPGIFVVSIYDIDLDQRNLMGRLSHP
jgi:hypothetical protein